MGNAYWIALGDIHMDTVFVNDIQGLAQAAGVLVSGDITNVGSPADARKVIGQIRSYNPNIRALVGNMDTPEVADWLEEEELHVHNRIVSLHPEVNLFSVGYSNITPFNTPLEVEEEVMASWLQKAQDKCRNLRHLVFMTHTPPIDSRTDIVGNGAHVGSPAVREFIEVVQPEICITGHIHEAVGEDWIGNCPVINPGMAGKGGYVRMDFTSEGLKASLEGTG